MKKSSHFVSINDNSLHYEKIGSGDRTMLAFHGFGQDASAFDCFEKTLGERYTIYAFDLFFHGESTWQNKKAAITKENMRVFFQAFLLENQIKDFSIMAFSLGARFLFTLLELCSTRVDSIILVAPDGVTQNFWYRLATGSSLMRNVFHGLVHNPAIFFKLIEFLRSIRAINLGLYLIAKNQMISLEKREKVYFSWVLFRKLSFDVKSLVNLINKNRIHTSIFLGASDVIIKRNKVKPLIAHLTEPNLTILESGHFRLLEAVNNHLAKKS